MSQSGGGSAASGSGSGSGSVVSTSTFGGISLVISEVEQSSSAAAEPVAVAGLENEWDVDLPLSGHSHIVPASAPRNCLVCGWQCDVCDDRTKINHTCEFVREGKGGVYDYVCPVKILCLRCAVRDKRRKEWLCPDHADERAGVTIPYDLITAMTSAKRLEFFRAFLEEPPYELPVGRLNEALGHYYTIFMYHNNLIFNSPGNAASMATRHIHFRLASYALQACRLLAEHGAVNSVCSSAELATAFAHAVV